MLHRAFADFNQDFFVWWCRRRWIGRNQGENHTRFIFIWKFAFLVQKYFVETKQNDLSERKSPVISEGN